MRREEIVDAGLVAVLASLALFVALPFRAEAIARTPVTSVGWDAALHATEGLDLFDDLRLFRPLDALALLASRHWWGPLWALVSAPFQAAFGPSLAAASLPSLLAFVLAPSAAFLLVRRLGPGGGPMASTLNAVLVAGLFLRSPMLLEVSAWPMLESLGGLLALLAFLSFARREEQGARRTAFLVGGAAFLLKYHFGFFVLGTFLAVVLVEEDPNARRRLRAAARDLLLRGAGAVILALAAILAATRSILEARGRDGLVRYAPSIPNIAWGSFVLFVLLLGLRRQAFAEAWTGASATFRDLVVFGLLPPVVWCLDPANVRGWYRQIFQPTDAPERNPLAKLVAFGGFLRDDYALGAIPAGLVLLGLLLALVLPGETTRRALAAFAIWPALLMSLSSYPVEPRFLACLVPGLLTAAVAGLGAGASGLGRKARATAVAATLVLLAVARDEARWKVECSARAPFRFSYGPAEVAAVNASVANAPEQGPIRLQLPPDPPVWPTVRFALRLRRRDLSAEEVVVSTDP
ncbi:MAG: hypothetical protein ACHQJD_03815 [Thermoanaerobaculia bacterium]